MIRVQALEAGRASGRTPLLPHMRPYPPGVPGYGADAADTEPVDIHGSINLTLPLGQLANEKRDRNIYDEKVFGQAEYRFDGGRSGGAAWKSKVERYFITKIPVALELLKWAEAHNLEKVDEVNFINLAHPYLTEEQCQCFNREVWAFLSG